MQCIMLVVFVCKLEIHAPFQPAAVSEHSVPKMKEHVIDLLRMCEKRKSWKALDSKLFKHTCSHYFNIKFERLIL